jgi:ATP-dependent Clp protease ATP-binding subunit ClpB
VVVMKKYRVLQILQQKDKNNPMLAARWETAIAEGLAHRIVDGDVRKPKDKIVYSLDMGAH